MNEEDFLDMRMWTTLNEDGTIETLISKSELLIKLNGGNNGRNK